MWQKRSCLFWLIKRMEGGGGASSQSVKENTFVEPRDRKQETMFVRPMCFSSLLFFLFNFIIHDALCAMHCRDLVC